MIIQENHSGDLSLPISRSCRALEVSRSGYYKWRTKFFHVQGSFVCRFASHAQAIILFCLLLYLSINEDVDVYMLVLYTL
jgi:hypothetical protein